MPSLFKNSSSKALLLILNLSFHLIFVSEAALTIDTSSLSTSDGAIIKAVNPVNLAGSSAGDFNGDGYEDILIGTPKVSLSNGLAYVIFGTATGIPTNINLNSLTTTQGITISPVGTSVQIGFSVSALGDINGDLIDDIIIGAYGNGKAYVIFGRKTGLSNIDLSVTDISTTGQGIVLSGPTQLGYQVGSAGDFNNDGINDFMVSAPLASSNQGAVYVIFGKSTIATSFNLNAFTLTPTQGIQIVGGTKFGYSLNSAGDFNNDRINDIMMGTNQVTNGIVAIVYGTSTPASISDISTISPSEGVVITGTSSNIIGAKNSISSAGDLNNDGITDVALGVPTYGTKVGLTYVIYGKSGGFSGNIALSSSYNGFQITGDSSGAAGSFGTAVTSADINGDGLSDLIIGAPTAIAPAGTTAGIVYVLFGNRNGFANLDFTKAGTAQLPQVLKIYGDTAAAQLGMDLSFAKDLNKDGVNDLVMLGSPEAYIIYGSGCTSVTQCTSTTPPVCYASKGCTCSIDLSELFQDNQCVASCTTGYYPASQTCELCPALCSSCTSPSDCQTCTSGNTPQAGSCNPCSGATYYDSFSSACKSCPPYCATCASTTSCQTCVTGGFTLQSGLCQCPTGTYLDSSTSPSSCKSCPSYCASCTDSSTCQTCVAGGFTVQSGLCKCPAGTYLDSSTSPSSCTNCPPYCATCTSSTSCQTCNTGGFTVQSGLCNCPAGTSLDSTTLSCVSTGVSCPTFCASCISSSYCDTCVSGFVVQHGLCECPEGSYLDGSTCTICPTFCSSCTSSSSCQTCVSGRFTVQSGLCQCPAGTYLDESTCQSNDAGPDENDMHEINTINSITDVTNTVNSAGLTAASAIAPQDPGSVTAGLLAKMLQYIKYLNIPYSQRLELTFKDLNSTYGPFGVGPKMPKQVILEAPFHEIPERFVKFNVVSNFLVNFWDSLIFIAILSAVLLTIVAAEFGFVQIKKKPAPSILKLVRLNGQNFFMMQFYNVFGDVLLYITLDFRTVTFSSREAVISFFVSILFACIGCTILAIHFYILIRFSTFRKSLSWTSISKKEEFSKQYEGVDVFFKHFKDDTFMNQSFLLLFVIRNCMFNLVLGLMYSSPPLQASLILAMSALMLIYLVFLRSFNTIVNLLQNITCELILLIVNTCVLMMAQLDLTKDNSLHVRDQLSDVVIYTSLVFTFLPPIFLGIKLIVAVVDWYKSRNKPSRARINSKSESKMRRIPRNKIATISQQPPNIIINDQSVELSMLQNSFNTNLNGNESPIIKPLKPNDSPTLKREKFLLTNINSSQWEGQLIPGTTNQLMKTRGSNQNRLPQKSDRSANTNSSMLGSKMVNNSLGVMDESDVVNSFFVNNKARERWARKNTQGNIH